MNNLQGFKVRKKIDASITIVGFGLAIVGLVMILSASQILAAEKYGNGYFFFNRQLLSLIVGLFAYGYFLKTPIENLFEKRLSILYWAIILLVLVFLPIIGPKVAGVHRWLDLGFIRFQPAELTKLLLIIFFSAFLAKKSEAIADPFKVLLPFLAILTLISGLVILEPDMGTMAIIVVLAMAIFFAAGAPYLQFVAVIAAGLALMVVLIYAAPYRTERLNAFLNKGESSAGLGSSYHAQQALIAIGSGGWWGVGFGQGISKYSYLPQAHTDSIFAVIGEELGFVRTLLIITGFLYLGFKGYLISRRANSHFVKLLAIGITTMFIVQLLINIGGMLNLIPLTGVPMPFISYGGTSLLVSLAALGLLTNISREVQ